MAYDVKNKLSYYQLYIASCYKLHCIYLMKRHVMKRFGGINISHVRQQYKCMNSTERD